MSTLNSGRQMEPETVRVDFHAEIQNRSRHEL
jgi:hypothetical protein